MPPKDLLYLSEKDVEKCITPAEAVILAEKGIKADADGKVNGDKFYMNVGDSGFIKPFSGYLEGEDYAFVKTFSFFEGNRQRNLPVTDSMVILLDAQDGLPVCVMEANWITALKTGASTAVTMKYLAAPDSRVLTIFGAGGLGRMHLLCLNEVFDLDLVRIVDPIRETSEKFARELSASGKYAIEIAASPQEALDQADIALTVTTGSAENIKSAWLKPGATVARLGSYQEVALDLLLEVNKLVVDRWAYVSYRVPEMVSLIQTGKLSRTNLYAEWPDIVGGRVVGRETDDEMILYIALGIWGEYAAILPHVFRRAMELGLGEQMGE